MNAERAYVPTLPAGGPRKEGFARGWVIGGLLLLFGYLIQSFIAPLLLGGVFSVVVYPLYLRVYHAIHKPFLASGIVTLLFALLFLGPIVALVISGTNAAIQEIRPLISGGDTAWRDAGNALLERLDGISKWLPLTNAELHDIVLSGTARVGEGALDILQELISQVPAVLVSALVILVSLFCFLVQGNEVVNYLRTISVFSPANTENVLETLRQSCRSSIMASMVTGLIQASFMGIGAALLGVGAVLLVALTTLLCSFIPLFGTAPVSVGLAAYFLAAGDLWRAGFALLLGLLTGMSDNFIRPVLLGGGMSIHPLAAFVFTFGALEVIGFYGLFLGPVAAGMFFALLKLIPRNRPAEANVPHSA